MTGDHPVDGARSDGDTGPEAVVGARDAAHFHALLHIYHAVPQQSDGSYAARRRYVSVEDVAAHLRGDVTLAFCASTKYETGSKRWARFVAIDIDKMFIERLPVLAAALSDLGIAQAAFATGGSSVGKGKVITTFSKMVDRAEAFALAHLVYSAAHQRCPELIPEKPRAGDIELFPKKPMSVAWDGGLVRILGRNAGRNGPLEMPLDLEERPMDLRRVKPLSRERVSRLARKFMVSKRAKDQPRWVDALVTRAWTWTSFGGVRRMRSKMFALARYYLTTLGPQAGKAAYLASLSRIATHSPDLDKPSPSYQDKRNPVSREIAGLGAWSAALSVGGWEPLYVEVPITRPVVCSVSNGDLADEDDDKFDSAKRVYAACAAHVRAEGLWPHCFSIDLRTLAARLDVDKHAVSNALALAERHSLLVILHPGTSNAEENVHGNGDLARSRRVVRTGVPAMYGLVGKGESVLDVWADALQDMHLKARRAEHPISGIAPETFAIVGRLVVEAALGNLRTPGRDVKVA